MTTPAEPGTPANGPFRTVLSDARRGHAGLFWLTVVLAGLAVVTAIGIVVDPRQLMGAPVWLKPFKFALSFGLYALGLAWMLGQVRGGGRLGAVTGWVLVVGSVIEVAAIALQAARGRRSHYNNDTPWDGLVFSIMGSTVLVLWLATALLALVLARRPAGDPAIRSGVRLGLLVGLIGMGLGTLMVVQPGGGAHSVGVPDGGPGLPLFGWSSVGGDLRVGHFVGMHALQLLPLLAALLGTLRVAAATRLQLVRVAAAGYLGLVVLVTWQALRGQPLLAPDAGTLGGLVALLVAVGCGLALALGRRPAAG